MAEALNRVEKRDKSNIINIEKLSFLIVEDVSAFRKKI